MSAVDGLHNDFSDILNFLDESGEISWRSVADENFRKVLLVAATSHFERSITEVVVNFVEQVTSKDHLIKWFVQNKAVSRQYHTWFDWEKKNANKFFGLFGDSFKNHISEKVRTNNDL